MPNIDACAPKTDCFRYTSRKIQTVFNNNFGKYPMEEREKVKYFASDIRRTYYDTACIWAREAENDLHDILA